MPSPFFTTMIMENKKEAARQAELAKRSNSYPLANGEMFYANFIQEGQEDTEEFRGMLWDLEDLRTGKQAVLIVGYFMVTYEANCFKIMCLVPHMMKDSYTTHIYFTALQLELYCANFQETKIQD